MKELIGKIIFTALDKILIRQTGQCFQYEVLEHHYRIICRASIVGAVLILQFVVHKREVDQIEELTELMVLWH